MEQYRVLFYFFIYYDILTYLLPVKMIELWVHDVLFKTIRH